MLGSVYILDNPHGKILETVSSREELNQDEFILDVQVESSDDESEFNEYFIHIKSFSLINNPYNFNNLLIFF